MDSWIFLEFYTKGRKWLKCEQVIKSIDIKVISTVVLLEIKYKLAKAFGKLEARKVLNKIKVNKSILIIDVDEKVAEKAANLRLKYYKSNVTELSYADCIHLSTAILSKCKKFYSGDPDFKGINEIPIEIV
ncbi:MAG: PIN domain-containing protein [Candidatus Aenigmarchaeota archaeon]|nr:PIN domain-containing protein [Candidatus Aenigmarchaeota archaeon]